MTTREGRKVLLGNREMIYPSADLQELEDSSQFLNDRTQLLSELETKGYALLRGLHDREEVLAARLAVLRYIQERGDNRFREGTDWQQGILDHRCGKGCIPVMEGKNDISHSEKVLQVLEGPRVKRLFRMLFDEEPRTFDFKWLRGMHPEGVTGAHVDRVYMCWGTENLITIWTPFDDLPVEMGVLAMCEGSHTLSSFKQFQETYGNLDVEADNMNGTGWFTVDPLEITSQFGGQWKTTDFRAGDAMIFGMRTVHMSTANLTEKVRISCDTRWQPASEPADPRYVGECSIDDRPKFGVYGEDSRPKENKHTIEEFKQKWGFQL